MEQTQKQNQVNFHKHHLVIKITEIALFFVLFAFSTLVARASEITPTNIEILINQERVKRGFSPLKENLSLNFAAENKSRDMILRNYFEHYAYGLTPWMFIVDQNYDYLYAGENLAMDFRTSEGMVSAWMASASHRRNILNPDFEDIGVGVIKGEFNDNSGTKETTIVTNMFGTKKPAVIRLYDNIVETIKDLF